MILVTHDRVFQACTGVLLHEHTTVCPMIHDRTFFALNSRLPAHALSKRTRSCILKTNFFFKILRTHDRATIVCMIVLIWENTIVRKETRSCARIYIKKTVHFLHFHKNHKPQPRFLSILSRFFVQISHFSCFHLLSNLFLQVSLHFSHHLRLFCIQNSTQIPFFNYFHYQNLKCLHE